MPSITVTAPPPPPTTRTAGAAALAEQVNGRDPRLHALVDPVVDVVDARRLSTAIEHHRRESRRLAKEASRHRTALRELLLQRDRHVTQLRAAGWHMGRIGTLYKITKARVSQIITALRPDVDDGAEAVS